MSSIDKSKASPQSWDDNDDDLLIRLKEVDHLGWKQIANYFPGRTSNACQFRWRRLKSGQLKKSNKVKRIPLERSRSASTDEQSYVSESESYISNRIIKNQETQPNSQQFLQSNELIQSNPTFWTSQEDKLIFSRNLKGLSIKELSVILPNKTGREIEERIKYLERRKLSIASLLTDETSPLCSNENEHQQHKHKHQYQQQHQYQQPSITSRNSSSSSVGSISSSINNRLQFTPASSYSSQPQQYLYRQTSSASSITLPPLQNLNSASALPNIVNNTQPISNSSTPMFKYGDNSLGDQRLPSLSQVYSFINQ